MNVPIGAHPLAPSTFVQDKQGICHQLANEDRLKWTKVNPRHALTFNGPLEAGVRVVALLGAAFPRAFDLQR